MCTSTIDPSPKMRISRQEDLLKPNVYTTFRDELTEPSETPFWRISAGSPSLLLT